jgi:murein DD-endopeptidase MepM/ murein hydrolase activator NlpD
MAQMLREMKQAMTPEAEDQGLGGQMMGDTVTQELALALGKSGTLGVSELVATALARLDTDAGTPLVAPVSTPDSGAVAIPTIAAAPESASSAAAVTSQYGWRVDPLNGQHRFHAGLDLRAAYGQDVRASSGGVVTFAGEKPGYGLVIVVSHESGLETRYAHLSSIHVTAGGRVEPGEVIARSGNSGRATGPHLHFEVRQDGRPVDPGLVAGLMPAVGPIRQEAE